MNKGWIWLLMLSVIAVNADLAWRDFRQRAEIASLRAKLAAVTATDETRLSDLKSRLAKAEQATLAAQKKSQLSGDAGSDGPFPWSGNDPSSDPAIAAINRRERLREISRQYGEAFAKMNLPADRLAKLKELLLARDDSASDAWAVAKKSGLALPEAEVAGTQAASEVEDEIKGLFGMDAYNQLEEARAANGTKLSILLGVGQDMSGAGVPLSTDQVGALTQIYREVQNPEKNPTASALLESPADAQTGLTPLNQAIVDRASQVLSPAQFTVLQQSLAEDGGQVMGQVETSVTVESYHVEAVSDKAAAPPK
jgi:hypothetical protein